jgi:hypothetical protein
MITYTVCCWDCEFLLPLWQNVVDRGSGRQVDKGSNKIVHCWERTVCTDQSKAEQHTKTKKLHGAQLEFQA